MQDKPPLDVLPSGRHRLTREQVHQSQRGRLLFGMIEAVAENGYAKTTVADILKRVHISRETFYQHFADKHECFLVALDSCCEILSKVLADSVKFDRIRGPRQRFDHAIRVYLNTLASAPDAAKVFLLESYAAGDAARKKRFAVHEQFVHIVAWNFRGDPVWQNLPDPEFAAKMITGGIATMVASTLVTEGADGLPALHQPIMELLGALYRTREENDDMPPRTSPPRTSTSRQSTAQPRNSESTMSESTMSESTMSASTMSAESAL